MLSKRALEVLKRLTDPQVEDDGGLAVSGIVCFIGCDPTSLRVVNELLCVCAIKGDEIGSTTYYLINDTGRSILRKPELADEIREYLMRAKPFLITKDDRILPMRD